MYRLSHSGSTTSDNLKERFDRILNKVDLSWGSGSEFRKKSCSKIELGGNKSLLL